MVSLLLELEINKLKFPKSKKKLIYYRTPTPKSFPRHFFHADYENVSRFFTPLSKSLMEKKVRVHTYSFQVLFVFRYLSDTRQAVANTAEF